MADSTGNELLALNQRLLESIASGDWATYQELCDPGLTAFEPEAHGQLVEGLAFHEFYFKLGGFSARGGAATKRRLLSVERAKGHGALPLFALSPPAAADRSPR